MQNHNYSRKGDSRPTSDSVVRHSDFGNSNDKRNLQAYSDSKKVTNQYSNKSTSSNKNGHGEKKGVTDSSALHSLMNLSSAASNLRPYDGMQQHSSRPKLNLHNPINGNMLPVSSSISSIYNSSKDLSTTHQPSSKQGCGSGSGSCGGSGTRGSNSGSGSDLVFDGSKSSRGCGGNNSKDSKDYNSKVNNNFNQSAYVNDDTYDISNIRENVIDDNDSNPMDTNKNVISNGGCHGKKSLKRSHADLDDVASSEMRSRHSSYQTGNKSPQIGKEHKSNRPGKEDEKVKEVFRSCRCPGPDRDDIEIDLGFERDASNEVQAKSGGCGSNRNSNVLSKCGQVENDIDKNRSVDTDRTDDQYYRHDMRNNISPADMEENPTFYPGDDQRSASGSASRSASRSRSRSNSDSDQSSRSRSVPHDTDIVNLCSSPTYSGHDSDIALNRIGNRLQNGNNNNGNGSNTMLIDQSQLLTTHDSNMPLTSCTAATSDSSLIHASVPLRGIKSIRFERMSATEWEMKENRIFNIDSLLAETGFVVHLVNESKFSPEEMRDMLLVGRSAGFVNLQSELQQRKALIASWPKAEHSNFANFINEWRKDQNADLALMNFWNSSASRKNEITKRQQGSGQEMPLVDGINSGVLSNGDVKCDMLDIVTQGTGVIVYEMVMKIGFIIRANKSLNIPDDCWRVIYSRELHSTSLQAPFSTFLGDLFPQLRSVLAKFDNLEECVVKYCPHSASNEKLTKPPSMLESSYYQTIGTMTETSADMIGRYDNIYNH